jgi:hypothetical protein
MTLDDVRALLDGPSPAALLTYRPDGSADLSPVWFRFTGAAFELVIAEGDPKLGYLATDPRAVLSVFETVPPFRGVKVRADAELTTDGVAEVRLATATRYLGPERGERFASSRGPGVVVRLPASAAHVWDLTGILP